jgi:SAM-dependent methyltransferase
LFKESNKKVEGIMGVAEPRERHTLIRDWAIRLQGKLREILPSRPNEAEFRKPIERLLEEFCHSVGVSPLTHTEYTLATGRADAVFNRMVIEYERPGTLKLPPDKATRDSVEQVRRYLDGIARRERHAPYRLAGVVFDGYYLIFVRRIEERWAKEGPIRVNENSLERFLTWLSSLSSGLALTAENLNRDFSIEQLRTQTILRAMYDALQDSLRDRESLAASLFEQWRLFFSEAIDYSEAFGGRKLESLRRWVRKAGLEVYTAEEAERFFFVLHTYFALLVKLLAWMALSRHMALKLGAPSFAELYTADSATLRRRLREMEDGGIFRAYGLANLLEGDFFSWYLQAWGKRVEEALREILRRLDEYEPATLAIVPEETRDLFKKLYHYLLPREIRHNLGEYYTPDWLAQRLLVQVDSEFFTSDPRVNERRLRKRLLETRFLDPACGSGTFLTLIIGRMRDLGQALMVRERDLLEAILRNVVGFDLNPLAVLTARVNYLLAIADLLEYRRGEISIPVYLADSVRTPAEGEDLYTSNAYEFRTAVGNFLVPAAVARPELFDRFCDLLEESVRDRFGEDSFVNRLVKILGLSSSEWDSRAEGYLRRLYRTLQELDERGLNGLWARLLKNNFAPLAVGEFDYVVGNPPWVNWEHLPDQYRDSTKPIWVRYGLFPHGGMDTILGKGKKDISMLMTYVVCDGLLKPGGRLGFVITQSVLKTSGAGQGFRRFQIPKGNRSTTPLKVIQVDDMVALDPFEGASNRTAVIVLEKGRPTRYPVPYLVWRKRRGDRFTYDSTLEEVIHATRRLRFGAEPVDSDDPTSPWLTARPRALRAIRKVLGRSGYVAHAGVYTGGANAVYWVDVVGKRPDGLVVVRNITEGAKVKVNEVTEPIEPDLLYPLLRGRDVRRWRAEPSAWILMVQDPKRRRGIEERELRSRYPRVYGYLKKFEKTLRERAAFKRYFTRRDRGGGIIESGPFYSMFDVGDYTFAPWKVVWREQGSSMTAGVVGLEDGKPTVPDHKCMLVDCRTPGEAYYVCALLNSSLCVAAVLGYAVEIQMDPHILKRIRIPRFDPKNRVHRRLADLSARAHEAARHDDGRALTGLEAEVDRFAARLWELTDEELAEIRRSLRELAAGGSSLEEEVRGGEEF